MNNQEKLLLLQILTAYSTSTSITGDALKELHDDIQRVTNSLIESL